MGGKFNARQKARGDFSRKFKEFKNKGGGKFGRGNRGSKGFRPKSNNPNVYGECGYEF